MAAEENPPPGKDLKPFLCLFAPSVSENELMDVGGEVSDFRSANSFTRVWGADSSRSVQMQVLHRNDCEQRSRQPDLWWLKRECVCVCVC